MKQLNMPLPDDRHRDLELIAYHYSTVTGTKCSKAAALKRLLYECANVIRNTGRLPWSDGVSSSPPPGAEYEIIDEEEAESHVEQ